MSNSEKKKPKDVDEKLRAATDKAAALQAMKQAAATVTKKDGARKNSKTTIQEGTPPGTAASQPQLKPFPVFESFEVLGETSDGEVLFWSILNRKIYSHNLKSFQFDQLVQIGGDEVRKKVGRGKRYDQESDEGQHLAPFQYIKESLIIEASRRQLGELSYFGQGIHFLKNGKLLIVNGGDGWVWDGRTFQRQEHPLLDSRLIDWNTGRRWIDFEIVQKIVSDMTVETAREIAEEICEHVNQWGFARPNDVYLLAGWFFAQAVQQVWDWRPHLWLTGSAGSGKTILLSLLEGFSGPLAMRREGKSLTEAGLRQDMGNDAVFTFVDEFEKSEHRDAIVEYLRSASRGGVVVKGTTAQKPVHFYIRCMSLLASIEYSLARAAERSRFLIVELQKDDSRKPILPNAEKMEALRLRATAFALWACFQVKALVAQLGRITGFEDRLIESYAVPLGMIAVTKENPLVLLRKMVVGFLDEAKISDRDDESDEQKVLRDVAFAKIRLPIEQQTSTERSSFIYLEVTVAQAIERLQVNPDNTLDDALQAVGIKLTEDRCIFLVPTIVTRKLLRDTPWAALNIESILRRIPGAKHTRLRIAGNRCYGLLLPRGVISAEVAQ